MESIFLSGEKINYFLEYKNVKNLNLRIKPNGNIYVSVNNKVSRKQVESFLISKSDFILKSLQKMSKHQVKNITLSDGDIIKVLGCEKTLCLNKGKNGIQIIDNRLILSVKDVNDYELKKTVIESWQKSESKRIITSVCKYVYPLFEKCGVIYPTLKFRKMVSRWGSCQPKNNVLTFNTKLVEKPLQCIEYVVFHEFTHFLVPNHSKEFYQRLSEFLPDHKIRKELLNTN